MQVIQSTIQTDSQLYDNMVRAGIIILKEMEKEIIKGSSKIEPIGLINSYPRSK